jgi:DNA-binding NarL/FixJ family response regulator
MENSHALKILIFEDISGESELIQHEIRKANVPVVFQTAYRKNDFHEKMTSFHPDLVVSDDSNPELNGMRVISTVRCNLPDAEFIILSIDYTYGKIAEYSSLGAYFITYDHMVFLPALVKRLYQPKLVTSAHVIQDHGIECW